MGMVMSQIKVVDALIGLLRLAIAECVFDDY
jgi:hypothetical protein